MKIDYLKEVNKIYRKYNPSTYFRNQKDIQRFVENRKNFLLNLKLPQKIFTNSTAIDFGSGSGQNSIIYDWLGSKCTLIEYDKKSYQNCLKLFRKYSRNKFQIINKDIFKIRFNKKKFDFVISNGVAHHTKDPKKNIKICCDVLKKNGFFILGIGNRSGAFQRNIQRLILYKISENEKELVKYAKILFKEHLKRSIKYSGRTINEVIHDTYLNPKAQSLSTEEIKKNFKKNNLILYSSFDPIKKLVNFLEPNLNQFKLINKKNDKLNNFKDQNDLRLSEFQDLTISNNKVRKLGLYKKLKKLNLILNKLTKNVNDKNFISQKYTIPLKTIINYRKNLLNLEKINVLDKKHNQVFLDETIKIFKILSSNRSKLSKYKEMKNLLKRTKKIFKGVNGVGMSYYVGYKIK